MRILSEDEAGKKAPPDTGKATCGAGQQAGH
jgi:hypothetical protein